MRPETILMIKAPNKIITKLAIIMYVLALFKSPVKSFSGVINPTFIPE